MMTSLKVVLVATCILQNARLSAGQGSGGAAPSAGAQPSPGSGPSIPAHDATDRAPANHQANEATNSEKSDNSPGSHDDTVTLITVLGVLFLILGIGLSFATYKVSKREAEAKPAPQVIGDTEEKKFGHVSSDASTAASDAPAVV